MELLPEFRNRAQIKPSRMNPIVRAVNLRKILSADGLILVTETPQGTALRLSVEALLPRIPKANASLQRMQIIGVLDDYLTCRTWDGETQGDTNILVAKPWSLRKTGWENETRDGVTYSDYMAGAQERTATEGEDSESQVVVITYMAGDEIYAVEADTGVTGCYLIDCNLDGRAWAKA